MQVQINVPEGESGDWRVEHFEVSDQDFEMSKIRAGFRPRELMRPGSYVRLMHGNTLIMSNTHDEALDHLSFIWQAKRFGGDVLINGLGLGMCIAAIQDHVNSITVIEKSEDVIKLVSSAYPDATVIHANALEWAPPRGTRYSAVWHDIWPYICADNLPEMHKLHHKYGRKTDWQGSWCRHECERQAA